MVLGHLVAGHGRVNIRATTLQQSSWQTGVTMINEHPSQGCDWSGSICWVSVGVDRRRERLLLLIDGRACAGRHYRHGRRAVWCAVGCVVNGISILVMLLNAEWVIHL